MHGELKAGCLPRSSVLPPTGGLSGSGGGGQSAPAVSVAAVPAPSVLGTISGGAPPAGAVSAANAQGSGSKVSQINLTAPIGSANTGASNSPGHGMALRIDVVNLSVNYGSKKILRNIFFSVLPNEAWAVLGSSGGGKSTLLKAMTGQLPYNEGSVLYAQNKYEQLPLGSVGYVPQDDIVHQSLKVDTALYYGALLRLSAVYPGESEEGLRKLAQEAVALAIGQVELTGQKNLRISKLSGGQRKRVSVALELLTSPGALFLDEPTSGLDPALEGRMTKLFCRTAHQNNCTVMLTTHSMQSLLTMDMVLMLAKGRVVWCGPPRDMLAWFQVIQFGDIYELLEGAEEAWADKYLASAYNYQYVQKRLESAL